MLIDQIRCVWFTEEPFNEKVVKRHIAIPLSFPYRVKDAPVCICAQPRSRVRLCDPVDCSPPGSSVPGIPQARILEWVATPFSRGSSRPGDQTRASCVSCIDRQVLYR